MNTQSPPTVTSSYEENDFKFLLLFYYFLITIAFIHETNGGSSKTGAENIKLNRGTKKVKL